MVGFVLRPILGTPFYYRYRRLLNLARVNGQQGGEVQPEERLIPRKRLSLSFPK